MNVHSFHESMGPCPICHRHPTTPVSQVVQGLLKCQRCRTCWVVSRSGHYVRDPFSLKPLVNLQLLRRQSRPLARLLRDLGACSRPALLAFFASALLSGVAVVGLETSDVPVLDAPVLKDGSNTSDPLNRQFKHR